MSKLAIRKGKKQFIPELNSKKTIVKETVYFVPNDQKDFHTKYGTIDKSNLNTDGKTTTKDTNKEFVLIPTSFIDIYRRIRKLPQTIPPKDLGYIAAQTGINKDSIVLDAGAGSGAAAIFFGHLCKKVITYEVRDDHADVVERNIKNMGLKNITLKRASVYDKVTEKNTDLFLFDLPEPWKAIDTAHKALKLGGFLVSYSPNVPSVMDFVNKLRPNDNFLIIDIAEVIERHWEVEDRKVRPKTAGIGHSGFLVFARKIL